MFRACQAFCVLGFGERFVSPCLCEIELVGVPFNQSMKPAGIVNIHIKQSSALNKR